MILDCRARGEGDNRWGKARRGGEAATVVILRVNLDEFVAKVAEFHPDRAVGGLDCLFLPAEGSALHPFHPQAKGGGFAEYDRGKPFGVGREGENGEKMTGPPLFHDQRRDGSVEGAFGHQSVDGMCEMLARDVIEMGADFKNSFRGIRGN